PGDAAKLVSAIDGAMEEGQSSTSFKGEEIPATPSSRAAVQNVADLEEEISRQTVESGTEKEPSAEPPTYFLKVGENFETLEYSRFTTATDRTAPFDPPPLPSCVRSTAKAHQVDAFAWLTEAWERKVPGLLLADDMGLGKTFQALTF